MANLPNPVTRIEEFLSAAAGQPVRLPTPVTREEIFLAAVVAGIDVIKDDIKSLSKLKQWLGDTTTPLYEDATVDTIVISGEDVQVKNGDVARYNGDEFIFSEVGTWQPYNDELDVYTKDESDARYLQKSGGALIGDVTTSVTTFTSTSLVTRQFVEDAITNITDYESEVFPNG